MSERRYIYVLFDPIDGNPRYVGRTRDPQKLQRLHPSKWAYSKGNDGKNNWIRDLISNGLRPRIVVYEDSTIGRAGKLQRIWIEKIREWSDTVYNLDKSQKCREASLRLWKLEEFRTSVKEGCNRRQERILREKLEKIPAYGPDSPPTQPIPPLAGPPEKPRFLRIRTPREEMSLARRRINRFLNKAIKMPPMTAFK
jgi:hypothetical protein